MKRRCEWVGDSDPLYIAYHDTEWGVPVHDDRKLFEFIVLESAQAGLSWRTILNKREGYRKAFKGFDPKKVARMDNSDIERLMSDASIVRNRLKITATLNNAKRFLEVRKEFGSFSEYMWSWTNGKSIQNRHKGMNDVPAVTELAEKMAKDLKKRGFSFLGPTVWYAHMQAVGMVNDHTTDCFRYKQIQKMK
jgi:DNA-3-methyladenine glycosylase I